MNAYLISKIKFAAIAVAVMVIAGLLQPGSLLAESNVTGAAAAFERGQAAELNGNFAQAAELYELADRLAPSAEALRSALRMRKAAGQAAIAATHAERLLRRYPDDTRSRRVAEQTLAGIQSTLTRIEITCDADCSPLVDGGASGLEPHKTHVLYVTPGAHNIVASFPQGSAEPQIIRGAAGQRVALVYAQPEVATPTPMASGLGSGAQDRRVDRASQSSRGLSPWWFGTTAVITAGLLATTIWSGLDVRDAHNKYDRTAPDAQARYEDGKDRERRTNILIAATASTAALTIGFAIFTRWSKKPKPDVAVAAGPNGVAFQYSGRW